MKITTKRKTLIEERYYGIKWRKLSFISMIQQRMGNLQTSWTPYLPNDLIFKIFLMLPIKSLLRFSCVCKAWHKLIHCAEFVEAYNACAETTPIFFRTRENDRLYTFHVETQLNLSESFSLFPRTSSPGISSNYIHFLEIEDKRCNITDPNISCSGNVVAACGGLILIASTAVSYWRRYKKGSAGRLILMNPMTRKFTRFPLGTLSAPLYESYGLVFSHSESAYKIVHFFKDELGYVSCEILSLRTRSWRAINVPSWGHLREFEYAPVSAIGALHWFHDLKSTYIVSLGADDEEIHMTDLPDALGMCDRLVEMGGFLSFVRSLGEGIFDVWILKGLEGVEWIKQHTIYIDPFSKNMIDHEFWTPAFSLNAKEVVFRCKNRLYLYDFELEEVKLIEIENGELARYDSMMPHTNNLATWEPLERMS